MADPGPPRADWEPTQGIIRVRAGHLTATDPFDFALAVSGDEGVATLKGLKSDVKITAAHRVAIFEALRQAGFHTALWRRHVPGSDQRFTRTFALT